MWSPRFFPLFCKFKNEKLVIQKWPTVSYYEDLIIFRNVLNIKISLNQNKNTKYFHMFNVRINWSNCISLLKTVIKLNCTEQRIYNIDPEYDELYFVWRGNTKWSGSSIPKLQKFSAYQLPCSKGSVYSRWWSISLHLQNKESKSWCMMNIVWRGNTKSSKHAVPFQNCS